MKKQIKTIQRYLKEKSASEYISGKITFTEAAHRANTSLWEMQQLLIQKGFRSNYSIEDVEEEINFLKTDAKKQ